MNKTMSNAEFQPLDSGLVPRFAGFPTFMRLPMAEPDQVDVALVGVPFDPVERANVVGAPGHRLFEDRGIRSRPAQTIFGN